MEDATMPRPSGHTHRHHLPRLVLSPRAQAVVHGSGAVGRFNTGLALRVTTGVGSMWCAYAFALLALISLPAALRSGDPIVIVSWLAGVGLVAVLGIVGYLNYLMFTSETAVRPVVAGRPLPWLALQVLALTIGVSILALAASWWSARQTVTGAERALLGALLTGGVVFIAWAAYWGLLMP
jgi:hypothetical protein